MNLTMSHILAPEQASANLRRAVVCAGVLLLAYLVGSGVAGYAEAGALSASSFFALSGLLLMVLFVKPLWGVLFLLLYFPTLGTSDSVSRSEFFALSVVVTVCAAWFFSILKGPRLTREERGIALTLAALLSYTCFSLLVALKNGSTFLDWGRDFFPFFLLVFLLPVARFVKTERQLRLAFGVFLVVAVLGILPWFFDALRIVGLAPFPAFLKYIPFRGRSVAMYTLMLVGAVSLLEHRRPKPQFLLPAAICFVAASLTRPRTMWVGMVFALVVLLVLAKRRTRWVSSVLVLAVCLTIGARILAGNRPVFVARQQENLRTFENLGSDLSWQSRMAEARQVWALFARHPFLGVGVGYQYNFWRPWVPGGGSGYMRSNFTHSDFMNYLGKTGLIGVSIIGLLLFQAVALCWKGCRETDENEARMVYLVVLMMLLVALLISNSTPVLQSRDASFSLATLIGLALARRRLDEAKADGS